MLRYLNYRPAEFKNETLEILTDAQQVRRVARAGSGKVSCPTTESCSRCGGIGLRQEQHSRKDKEFFLNRITSGSDLKYEASGLPVSGVKIAVAGALSAAAVSGIIALLAFLA